LNFATRPSGSSPRPGPVSTAQRELNLVAEPGGLFAVAAHPTASWTPAALLRWDVTKEAELLVLRHENVARCHEPSGESKTRGMAALAGRRRNSCART